jgi:sugar lactone lactonase YvrE
MITTVAGSGHNGYNGDGGQATSTAMTRPYGVTLGRTGSLYIADQGNQRVRKVSGGIISTIIGGAFGDGALAVFGSLDAPSAVATDKIGNVYVADSGHNSVRRTAPDGAIMTLAGAGISGYSGDGGAAIEAQLNQPGGIAVDASGAVYIADSNNHRIRKVATDGTITTIVGTGRCFGGDGDPATQAQLTQPQGLFLDASDTWDRPDCRD